MRKAEIILWFMLALFTSLNATTLYEDGEDGTTNGWRVRKAPAIITNVYSPSQDSRAIRITNGGSSILGAITSDAVGSWNNRTEKTISWKMVVDNRYTVYVVLSTTKGIRYLFYNDLPRRYLFHGFNGGILYGLGGYRHDEYKGVWRTYTRNLERDLKDAEPDNELISVNGFIYNGSNASIDDIILYNPEESVYEDGENGIVNWGISDNSPAGATITNIPDVWDDHAQGNVIRFQGSAQDNAYTIGSPTGEGAWNNTTQRILQWKSRYYENYEVRISVQTTLGSRDLLYVNTGRYTPSGGVQDNGQTIWHELGRGALVGLNNDTWRNGATNDFWQTVTRDLEQDLKDFEPNNSIVSVNAFTIKGSGLIDDIKMLSRPKVEIVYEDAENGNTDGWSIFSNVPEGATITNVEDAIRGSRVIQLLGAGKSNGYMLGNRSGDNAWNDTHNRYVRWSMNYSEEFTIYLSVETTNGRRYLVYSPRDDDRGLRGQYILIGLGANASNGIWQTFTRNLAEDIARFEADNELVSVNAFMIRGSGRLDDILMFD